MKTTVAGSRQDGFGLDFGCLDRQDAKLTYSVKKDVWGRFNQ